MDSRVSKVDIKDERKNKWNNTRRGLLAIWTDLKKTFTVAMEWERAVWLIYADCQDPAVNFL